MKKIKGDIVELFEDGFFDIIAHGCNCIAIMGAGVAKQIADKFPDVRKADIDYEGKSDSIMEQLGTYSVAEIGHKKVFNLYTQPIPGNHFDFTAFRLAIKSMKQDLPHWHEQPRPKIGFPYIGCGIGGFQYPELIERVIAEELSDYDVYIVEYAKQNSGS